MKTNQMMTVNFGGNTMEIEHLTGMGNLTELWAIGNAYREKRGLAPLDLRDWLRRPQTEEFVRVIEDNLNLDNTGDSKCGELPHLEFIENTEKKGGRISTIKSPLIITKKGRYGGTWAHLYLLIDAATYLDAQFKFEVYQTFITNKLLEWRDSSGDEFKSLNLAIDAYLPDRDGKDNKGIYIQIALAIKRKILTDGDDWNTATPAQLEKRTQIERRLIDILRIGLVRDYIHMKEVVAKL